MEGTKCKLLQQPPSTSNPGFYARKRRKDVHYGPDILLNCLEHFSTFRPHYSRQGQAVTQHKRGNANRNPSQNMGEPLHHLVDEEGIGQDPKTAVGIAQPLCLRAPLLQGPVWAQLPQCMAACLHPQLHPLLPLHLNRSWSNYFQVVRTGPTCGNTSPAPTGPPCLAVTPTPSYLAALHCSNGHHRMIRI